MLTNFRRNRVLERAHAYNLDAADFVRLAMTSAIGVAPALVASRVRAEASSPAEQLIVDRAASSAEARVPDHILLNLPADSLRFLPALRELRDAGPAGTQCTNGPLVHCYSFSKLAAVQDQISEAHERVSEGLGCAPVCLNVRPVRSVAPGKEMLCYEFPLQVKLPDA